MAVAARPRSLSTPTARPGVRPMPPRRPASATAKHHTPPKTSNDTLRLILIGVGLAIAALVGVGVIWEFGAGRNLPRPSAGLPSSDDAAGGAGAAPTMVYRDMHDGRVMVMEVGPDGTRIKGTIDKGNLPIAGDMAPGGVATSSRSSAGPNSNDRVNALGSAFRK